MAPAALSHDDITAALSFGWPDSEWSYDGDGSTLDPVEDDEGNIISRGLEWHGDGNPPTLSALAKILPEAQLARDRADKLTEIAAAYQAGQVAALAPGGQDYLTKLQKLYTEATTADDPASIVVPAAPGS